MAYKIFLITVMATLFSQQIQSVLAAPTLVTTVTTKATAVAATTKTAATQFNLQITNRTAWQAAPSRKVTAINGGNGSSNPGAVAAKPYVIIHHTASPGACHTAAACKATVRSIQRSHQSERGWDDIGYNFLIGGDGAAGAAIYEGRGFGVIGAHAVGYNSQSVGICLIGNWSESLPPADMLEKLRLLITYGIQIGHIQKNYKLLGHRQVRATECPGNKYAKL